MNVPCSQSATLLAVHRQPLAVNEMRAPQYGEVWMRHVMEGGAVRDGNILIVTPRKGTAAARRKR